MAGCGRWHRLLPHGQTHVGIRSALAGVPVGRVPLHVWSPSHERINARPPRKGRRLHRLCPFFSSRSVSTAISRAAPDCPATWNRHRPSERCDAHRSSEDRSPGSGMFDRDARARGGWPAAPYAYDGRHRVYYQRSRTSLRRLASHERRGDVSAETRGRHEPSNVRSSNTCKPVMGAAGIVAASLGGGFP